MKKKHYLRRQLGKFYVGFATGKSPRYSHGDEPHVTVPFFWLVKNLTNGTYDGTWAVCCSIPGVVWVWFGRETA